MNKREALEKIKIIKREAHKLQEIIDAPEKPKKKWAFEIIDINRVPPRFMESISSWGHLAINNIKVLQDIWSGRKEIPGLVIFQEEDI